MLSTLAWAQQIGDFIAQFVAITGEDVEANIFFLGTPYKPIAAYLQENINVAIIVYFISLKSKSKSKSKCFWYRKMIIVQILISCILHINNLKAQGNSNYY